MGFSMEIEEVEETKQTEIRKTPKKNRSKLLDDGVVLSPWKKRNIKGIVLSVTKPSYVLKRGIGRELRSLRWEHRNKLRYLLRQLVRRQNWDEACGVLSVLLKGTHRENYFSTNRTKYWAALELLQHMGVANVKPRKFQHVFEIWMKKNLAVTKGKRTLKGRFMVQLEFLLFCLSQGDTDGAYQAVISLLQESDFRSDPISNLVVGIAFCHLWYTGIQKELQLFDSHESLTPIQSETLVSKRIMPIDNSNGQSAVEVQHSDSPIKRDSNTSVRVDKAIDHEEVVDQNRAPMDVDNDLQIEIRQNEQLPSESDQSDKSSLFPYTGNKRYGSIFYAQDVECILMPSKLPCTNNSEDFISLQNTIHNDHYKAAVNHLKSAFHSTPPAFEALLPLIQMLLLGDQIKEAVEEVESAVHTSNAALPFRLKASLLEHFSDENKGKLCICYEDTLKKDPTCIHSLTKLITIHHDGYYSIEKLVEMIALHLDATYADFNLWKEFASCLLRLSHCDEDRMSTCVDNHEESYRKRSDKIPDMFKDNLSKENWRLRCRWWLTRHFSQAIFASEVASGDMELLTYKAASACHLYGPEFRYAANACAYLGKVKNINMLLMLKMHTHNPIRFYTS